MSDHLVSGRHLWTILWSRLTLVVLTTLLTLAVAFAFLLKQPRLYSAESTVLIEYSDTGQINQTPQPRFLPDFMETQLGILSSEMVATRSVELLEADGFDLSLITSEQSESDQSDSGFLKQLLGNDSSMQGERNDAVDLVAEQKKQAVAVIRETLSPYLTENSRLIQVLYVSDDAQTSAAISNAIADAYVETRLALSRDPAKRTAEFLQGQLSRLRKNLESAQSQLSSYQQEKKIVSADSTVDVEVAYLTALSKQLVDAQAGVARAQSGLNNIESALASGLSTDSIPEIGTNRLIQDLKIALARKEAELSELSTTYGSRHPLFLNLDAEVSTLRANLETEINSIIQAQRNETSIAKNREQALRAALDDQRRKLLSLRKARDDLPALVRDVEGAQRAYDDALRDAQKFELLGQADETNAIVLNRAVVADRPSSPKVGRTLLAAAVIGGLLGFAFALLLEGIDNRVRHGRDLVPAGSGIPILAEIPRYSRY